MVNDVNVLWVRYVNMPNTIFKATKAEEEKNFFACHLAKKEKSANTDNRKEENGRQ